jgi:hypothetical protein
MLDRWRKRVLPASMRDGLGKLLALLPTVPFATTKQSRESRIRGAGSHAALAIESGDRPRWYTEAGDPVRSISGGSSARVGRDVGEGVGCVGAAVGLAVGSFDAIDTAAKSARPSAMFGAFVHCVDPAATSNRNTFGCPGPKKNPSAGLPPMTNNWPARKMRASVMLLAHARTRARLHLPINATQAENRGSPS